MNRKSTLAAKQFNDSGPSTRLDKKFRKLLLDYSLNLALLGVYLIGCKAPDHQHGKLNATGPFSFFFDTSRIAARHDVDNRGN